MALDSDDNPYLPVYLPEFDVSVGWAMCRNTMCRNFGIQYAGPAEGEAPWLGDGRCEVNPRTGEFRCLHCGNSFELNSNRAIRKLARYFLSLSLPFAACPRPDCINRGRNAFEHHSDERKDRDRPYRRHQGERLLCREHAGDDRVTFAIGEPWFLDRKRKGETPEDRNRRRRAAPRRLRGIIKEAMYYGSVSMVLEDFEIDADTYCAQLTRVAQRRRDYQSRRNARLLHPDFQRRDGALRVYTDTLVGSVVRYEKETPRTTFLNIAVSVIDMPEERTYYILAAHPGFPPEELCQTDPLQLAREVAGPDHSSPWACAWHPPVQIDPSVETATALESLPDIGRGGWFGRSPYVELAHFLTVRKMLSGFGKVYYYMDANRQQSAAALTALADDIRAGTCEIALYQKRGKGEKSAPEGGPIERWPVRQSEQQQWLKAKLDAEWQAREVRWRNKGKGTDLDMPDEQLRAGTPQPPPSPTPRVALPYLRWIILGRFRHGRRDEREAFGPGIRGGWADSER